MAPHRLLSPLLATLALAACSGPPTPVAVPPVSTATTTASAGASASAPVEYTPPEIGPVVKLYPVAQVYSLIDVTETEGTIEVRLGADPGGGMIGRYRYVPIVAGALDFKQESSEVSYANTASEGSVQIAGKRPSLVRHAASGFRSSATDSYSALDKDSEWQPLSVGDAGGIGVGLYSWSEDRILEWRTSPQGDGGKVGESPHSLLGLRVLRGTNKAAPEIPAALRKRLRKEGFWTSAVTAFRTGEVVVVGNLTGAEAVPEKQELGKIGTLIWREDLKNPDYFTTPQKGAGPRGEADSPAILGGDSLASVRLRDGDRVLKLEGSAWVEDGKVSDKGMPDVWFGKPMVVGAGKGIFARVAQGAAWVPLAAVTPEGTKEMTGDAVPGSYAVDAGGVIWATRDDILFSSKQPASKMLEITEDDLVNRRKASVLGGGSRDATHEPVESTVYPPCSLWYVILDRMPVPEKDTTDYPEVRALLKGHSEWSGVKLVVSRERGEQLLGAETADEEMASKIDALVRKKGKKGAAGTVCAEPAIVRQLKIDFATGEVKK